MIRAFITTWTLVDNAIHNPIVDYVDTLPNQGITCNMYYPDADQNGVPDKPKVLILVEAPVNIEPLKNLQGVKMLPAYRFDKPVSEIPSSVVNAIKDVVVAEGIPLSALAGIVVYGDFLKKVAKYLNVDFSGFGSYESMLSAEFA